MLDKLCKRHWDVVKLGETASHVGSGRDKTGRFACDVCEVLERVRVADKIKRDESYTQQQQEAKQ